MRSWSNKGIKVVVGAGDPKPRGRACGSGGVRGNG